MNSEPVSLYALLEIMNRCRLARTRIIAVKDVLQQRVAGSTMVQKTTGQVTTHAWWRLEHVLEYTEYVRMNEKDDSPEKFFKSASEMYEYYETAYKTMCEIYEEAGFGTLVFDDEVVVKEGFDF